MQNKCSTPYAIQSNPFRYGSLLACVVLFFLYLLFASSCKRELEEPYEDFTFSEYTDCSFHLQTVPLSTPITSTCALSQVAQNTIRTIDLLVFKGSKLIEYHTGLTPSAGNTINVRLKTSPKEDSVCDIMLIANVNDFNYENKTRFTIQNELTEEIPQPDGWRGSEFKMYGEIKQTLIRPNTNNFSCNMLRSLARIDIGLGTYDQASGTWSGLPNFKLIAVHLYAAFNNFAVIPKATVYGSDGNIKVETPSIPNKWSSIHEPIYSGADITDSSFISSTIFAAEVPNKTRPTNNRMFVLLYGSYNNGPATFYPVEFAVQTAPYSYDYIDILRNHLYRFSIKKISGPGYTSKSSALPINGGKASNIVSELAVINEGVAGDIIFDEHSYIVTSAADIIAYVEPNDKTRKTFHIMTVTVGGSSGTKWSMTSAPSGLVYPTFENGKPVDIFAYIPVGEKFIDYTISAGKLRKVVRLWVQPPIDAHFDFLPFGRCESASLEGDMGWVSLSQKKAYVKTEQKKEITGNVEHKIYAHFDENIALSGSPRKARMNIRRTDGRTTGVIFEQVNLSETVIGRFGGIPNPNGSDPYLYPDLLAVEAIEEHLTRVYDDSSLNLTPPWSQRCPAWGFYGVANTFFPLDPSYAKDATYTLANRSDHGIKGELNIANTYVARYCYEKNRDLDGNGVIDANEVLWYMPSQNQMTALYLLNKSTYSGSAFWTGTTYNKSSNTNAPVSIEISFGGGQISQSSRSNNSLRVRCVRDLPAK